MAVVPARFLVAIHHLFAFSAFRLLDVLPSNWISVSSTRKGSPLYWG